MKKVLNAIWNEFIYGGHLLGLGPAIILWASAQLLNYNIGIRTIIASYLITYSVYSFDRFIGIKSESSSDRKKIYESKAKAHFVLIFLSVFFTSILLHENRDALIFGNILIFLGFLYGLFFKKITKYLIGFKSLFVSMMFSAVIFFNTIDTNELSKGIIILFLFFTLRWFINTSFCDIKDKSHDKQDGLKTLATVFSKQSFAKFIIALNFFSVIFIFWGVYLHILPAYSLLFVTVVPYYYWLLFLLYKKNVDPQKVCNIWADLEPILWLLIIFIGEKCLEY